MAIVRINEKGWNKFTGNMGGVEFVDGISVEEVSKNEIAKLAAAVRIEEVIDQNEDGVVVGRQLGISSDLARGAKVNAKLIKRVTIPSEEKDEESSIKSKVESKVDVAVLDENGIPYTRESLEKVADALGVNGIREIAKNFGVKGVSIAALIDKIVAEIEK